MVAAARSSPPSTSLGGDHVDPTEAVYVRVLGPVEAFVADRVVSIDAPKERAVLAVLTAYGGHPVSVSALIDALWDAEPPASAVKLVQGYVSALRRLLGERVIVTEASGYALGPAVRSTDVDELGPMVASARAAVDAGNLADARQWFAGALAMWRGEPFEELAESTFGRGQRARLAEERLTLLEDRIEADLECGRHRELVPELELLVVEEPLRERFWGFLMLALHRCDRSADALLAVDRLRSVLIDELDITPSQSICDLEARIRSADPGLTGTLARPPNNLPASLSSYVARCGEVERLTQLVLEHPLVTLHGAGGIGKSRLALEVAHALLNEPIESIWWVDLASVDTDEGVTRQIAAAMDVVPGPGTALADGLAARLRGRNAVLVLDNCELLVVHVARFVAWARNVSPMVRVLVTSRVTIGLVGEYRWSVPPLGLPSVGVAPDASEAVRLFVDRAADRVDIATLDLDAVGRICRILDGLPLAIELAAATSSVRTAAEIEAMLRDRRALLGLAGSHPSMEGTVSLREVLDLRRSVLDSETAEAFVSLSVFPGDFTLEAALAVVSTVTDEALAAVNCLIDSSLVMAVPDSGGARRFRLLWPVREFAAELLERPMSERASVAHAGYFRRFVVRGFQELDRQRESVALADLQKDLHNVMAALEWSERNETPNVTLEFAPGLGFAWMAWGEYRVSKEHLTRLLSMCADPPPLTEAWTKLMLGWPVFMSGEQDVALELVDSARNVFEDVHDRRGVSRALRDRAHMTLLGWGDSETSLGYYLRAIEVAEQADLPHAAAMAKAQLGQSLALGDMTDVVDIDVMLDSAERMFRSSRDHLGLAMVAMDRMLIAFGRDLPEALDAAGQEQLRHSRLANAVQYEQIALVSLGVSAYLRGGLDRRSALLREAVHLAMETGNRLQLGIALQAVAATTAGCDPRRAARLWGAGVDWAPLWPLFERRYAVLLEAARHGLGAEFDRLATAGAALTVDDAVVLSDEACRLDEPTARG